MAIFTFSTKDSAPQEEQTVLEIKKFCKDKGINFSFIVLTKLKEWQEEQANDRPR